MRDCLIVCGGSTLKDYWGKITKLLKIDSLCTFAINRSLYISNHDYHVWTNKKRYLRDRGFICSESKTITTSKMAHFFKDPIIIESDINIHRTAGLSAIQFAHDQGAKNIYIAGMDGYTLCYGGNQHCYGSGMTDSDDMEYEAEKDTIINKQLARMKSEGINFRIITPTVYLNFYDGSVLDV